MKKLLPLFVLLMLAALPALADATQETAIEPDEIVEVASGASIDLDGDGAPEKITYEISANEDETATLTIKVNASELSLELFEPQPTLYAGKLRGRGYDEVFLMASEYGMSCDYHSCIIYYDGDKLTHIGGIDALPQDMSINGHVITAEVRGRCVETWFRESDFVIAFSNRFDEETGAQLPIEMYVAESPRANYPMHTLVELKQDVKLSKSLFGKDEIKLHKGEKAVISATDDVSYIYIVPVDRSAHDGIAGGYMMLAGQDEVITGGRTLPVYDVFDGLFFAD